MTSSKALKMGLISESLAIGKTQKTVAKLAEVGMVLVSFG
jgi:hypothetical protein